MILIKAPKHNEEINKLNSMYPTKMICITESYEFSENSSSTMFGFVTQGTFEITSGNQTWLVQEGNFMSLKTIFSVNPLKNNSKMFAIIRYGYRGIDLVGKVESTGRLSYIDGCTDTLLISPPRKGDACLNHLHFPKNITQTQHLHPSIRMGIVINGEGIAFKKDSWEHPLIKGSMFCLPEGDVHSFKTSTQIMDIIAYHPDSDFGPTDENHPMLNKTLINHGKTN
jgi:quercetin dioxygenase-like cupin family protein